VSSSRLKMSEARTDNGLDNSKSGTETSPARDGIFTYQVIFGVACHATTDSKCRCGLKRRRIVSEGVSKAADQSSQTRRFGARHSA